MKRQPIWIALLLSTLALAGCMGGGGGEAEVEGSGTSDTTRDGGAGVNATAGASASATNESNTTTSPTNATGGDDEEPVTEEERRDGTAESTGIMLLDSPSEEPFAVQADVEEFTLAVNASGGELDVCIMGPTEDSECAQEFETEEGQGSVNVTAPAEGEWNVQLSPSGLGPQSVDYELVFRQTLPVGGGDNETGGQPTTSPSGTTGSSPTYT